MAKPYADAVAWEPQPGPQTLLVQCPAEEVFYGGAVGGGKLISDNELVVTPFGYRRHGDLKVGDTICAADGTPTNVVLVTERAVHAMYRISFDDGSSVVAGDEHLWNYSIAEKLWRKSVRKWKVGTTEQMAALIEAGHIVLIPLCKPVTFTKSYRYNMRPVDPYLLGVLLGDGHMGNGQVGITSADRHITDRALGPGMDGWGESKDKRSAASKFYARGKTLAWLTSELERIGLYGKTADSKFVPEPYLWGTTEDRYALLQGLMDTDGYIDERGQAYFTSISEQLAKDVRWLVFSLGGRATTTDRIPSYKYRGENLKGQRAYTVTIRMPDNRTIVSLPRKVERANAWRENGNGELKRRVASIEYVGREECHCIAVDHPESLYMVGDFIVTHNTDGLLGDYSRGIQYGPKWVGLFVRRYTPDMSYVIRRAQEIFCTVYGANIWKESKHEFQFPGGAVLQFRAADRDADALKHQGQQYCLAKGSLVRMADESLRAIEDIRAGEMVATISGPHMAVAVHHIGVRPCVTASYTSNSGSKIGEHDLPENSPILLASGAWGSYASLADDPSDCEASGCCTQEFSPPQALSVRVVLRARGTHQDADDPASSIGFREHGRSRQPSSETSRDLSGTPKGLTMPGERHQPPLGRTALRSAAGGASCGTLDLETEQGSQSDCCSCRRPHGGQPLGLSEIAQDVPPSPACGAQPFQSGCTQDDLGNAPRRSQLTPFAYAHPYTGEVLVASDPVTFGSCLLTPCGDRDVYDLTIEGVAHYITESGSCVKNTWIGFDELTQWESDYIYTYLFHRMRTAAEGIPIRMRSTSNPGGPGHNWVKARFIDIAPPGVPVLVTRKDGTTYYRVAIRSKLEDNRILMKNDPGYGGRVYEISDPVMARAMREGDWNIAVGAAFPEFDPKIHVIDNAPMPTDKKMLRTMDWGHTDPYCCLWGFGYDGDLIISGERYGWSGKANVGTGENPDIVRARLSGYERMNEIYVPYGWLDSQCWDTNSGIGMIAAELMGKITDPDHMVWHPWKKGPNSRVNQKQAVHQLMQVVNGKSRLKIMRRCEHLIRTLPAVVRDKHNNEDVDTNCEDHAYDALRAMIASGIPTRDEIRRRTMRQYQETHTIVRASDVPGGGF